MSSLEGFNFHHDQAAGLRRMMASAKPRVFSLLAANELSANQHAANSKQPDQTKTISNLAAALTRLGADVLVVYAGPNDKTNPCDLNAYPSMLDAASGQLPEHSNWHTRAHCSIKKSGEGYAVTKLLPPHTDIHHYDARSVQLLNDWFVNVANNFEIVLVDTAMTQQQTLPLDILNRSGIAIQLNHKSESIKNAYRLIKLLCNQLGRRSFSILVHDTNEQAASKVFNNLALVARRYMRIDLEYLGFIPVDDHLNRAAKLGRPVTAAFPMASASQAFKALALKFDYQPAHCGGGLLHPMPFI